MRINELLSEERLDEKPMGFLSKMKDKALAKLGSDRASGRLEAGQEANELKKYFLQYLGKTGKTAEPNIVLQWLKASGYPTGAAELAMQEPTGSQRAGKAAGKLAKGAAKVAKSMAKGAKGIAQTAAAGARAGMAAQEPAQGPQASAQQPAQNITQAPANVQKPAQPQQQELPLNDPNNPQQDLFDPNSGQRAKKPVDRVKKSQEQPVSAKGSQNGIKIAGAGKPRIKAKMTASTEYDAEPILETLTSKQLDKVFLAAVRDGNEQDMGAADTSTGQATNVAPGGFGGFAQGAKQGYSGDNQGSAAVATEPAGAEPADSDGGIAPEPERIPTEITQQIRKLNTKEKKQLLRMLG